MDDSMLPNVWPSASSGALTDKDIARIMAENESLRSTCSLWQRRAEVQSAATMGLIGLTRFARDRAVELKQERDKLRLKYESLKRKYAHLEAQDAETTFSPPRSPMIEVPEPSHAQLPPSHPIGSLLAEATTSYPRQSQAPLRPESPLGLSLLSLPDSAPQLEDLFVDTDIDIQRPPAKRRRTESPPSPTPSETSPLASPLSTTAPGPIPMLVSVKRRERMYGKSRSSTPLRRSPRNGNTRPS
ncbi:hypothetical protein ONZ45_g9057 [Pleurotus djamor]|nr:hypothetical protein ONZ45_g9057 [Pleurotus djamor]